MLNNSNISSQQQQHQQLLTPAVGQQSYENYYNATNYLTPYHHHPHAHLNPLNHMNQNPLQNVAAQSHHHYRQLQAADYMQAAATDYNAMQRSSAAAAADMWAAHKFHGV